MEENWCWPAIGIDFGSRFLSVGVCQYDRVKLITNDQGSGKTPSCVAFTDTDYLVGDAAKNQNATNPANTVYGLFSFLSHFNFILINYIFQSVLSNLVVVLCISTNYRCK